MAVEPLPAAPRLVATLAVHSQRISRCGALAFFLATILSLVCFWPILIKEDFEAYLQCDGPMHGRAHALRALQHKAMAKGHGRRLEQQERTRAAYFIKLIYTTRDGSNIFTADRLHKIRDIERRIESLPGYQDFCLSAGNGQCARPLTVVNYFFASTGQGDTIVPDGQGESMLPIQAILGNLGTSNSFFLDRYFGVSQGQLQSALEGNITRSVYRFGLPLKGFPGFRDDDHRQRAKFHNFVGQELYPLVSSASTEDIRIFYYGDELTAYEVQISVFHDAGYAIGSLLFILCYLIWYMRSFWLAITALACIAVSFPLSYACYCLVYGHGKMIAINFLSLFVVLGVGADDVFVLHDVWKHSRAAGTGEMALARRLWSLYCKAGSAIFATSATTAASFFANLASSIGPLRQFGFFMGTCIAVNYIVVASLYPFILVNHERSRCKGGRMLQAEDGAIEMEEQLVSNFGQQTDEEADAGAGRGVRSAQRPPSSEQRLSTPWRLLACGISLSGLVLTGGALSMAVRDLKPATGVPQFFPKESNLGALQDLQKRFGNESSVAGEDLKYCNGIYIPSAGQCTSRATDGQPPAASPPPFVIPKHLPQPKPLPKPLPNNNDNKKPQPQQPQPGQPETTRSGGSAHSQLPASTSQTPRSPGTPPSSDHEEAVPESTAPPLPSTTPPRRPSEAPTAPSPVVPKPLPTSPPPPPHPLPPSAPPPQSPPSASAAASAHTVEDFDVRLKVEATSEEEVRTPALALKAQILEELGLQPEDLDIDVQPRSEKQKDIFGRLLQEVPRFRAEEHRRLQDGADIPFEVTLHFHRVSPEKEEQVRQYMAKNKEMLNSFGVVSDDSVPTVPPDKLRCYHHPCQKRNNNNNNNSPPPPPSMPSSLPPSLPEAQLPHLQPPEPPSPPPPPPPIPKQPAPALQPKPTPEPPATSPQSSQPAHKSPRSQPPSPPPPSPPPPPPAPPQAPVDTLPPAPPPPPPQPPQQLPTMPPQLMPPSPPPRADQSLPATVTLPPLHLQKRGMAYDRTGRLGVVFGMMEESPGSTAYKLNPRFNLQAPEAQLALVHFCDMAEQKRSLKVMPGHTSCWPRDLRNSIESRGGSFPSYTLRQDVRNFLAQEPSIRDHLDLAEDGSVMWVLLEFHVEFDTHSSGRQIEPFMETWESFVVQAGKDLDQLYSGSAYPLGPAFPSTSLFERAEAENRVVNSALSSWLVSVGCALAALVVFTRSLWLSVIATFAMFATAACSLFFITSVFHWHFGLMEAVSLIIFCGFSVDYPLHVVQAYVQERDRGAGVRGALREVGGAVVSGCLTTCGAASFLLLCQIRLFTRFGQVLVVNMIFALIFALVWIPAVLECTTCGGGADESRKRPPLHQSDDAGFGRGLLHSGGTGTGRSLSEELDEVSSGFTVLGGGTPRGSRRS